MNKKTDMMPINARINSFESARKRAVAQIRFDDFIQDIHQERHIIFHDSLQNLVNILQKYVAYCHKIVFFIVMLPFRKKRFVPSQMATDEMIFDLFHFIF